MNKDRDLISRRIINLLSACKMYLDQSKQHISRLYGKNSEEYLFLEKEKKDQSTEKLSFRFMEALRNYVQHRDVPVHTMHFSRNWVEKDGEDRLLFRVIPKVNVSKLAEDNRFAEEILNELKQFQKDDWVDIRPFIREFIECIGKLHIKIREMNKISIDEWEKNIETTIYKFKNEFGNDVSLAGLVIVNELDNGRWGEYEIVFREFIDRRKALEKKNSGFTNYIKFYASNEIHNND